jgi:hypothetical protein
VDLFQRAPLLAGSGRFGLKHRRKLESVLVDGALGAPLGVGRLYGFRAQIAPDGVSQDAQTPGALSMGLVSNVPVLNNA